MDKKMFGFTLAEVLIVIGIIGIVVSITIPTLSKNIQTEMHKTALKKVFSNLNQAYLSIKTENSSIKNLCLMNDSICFAGLFQSYLLYVKEAVGTTNSEGNIACWGNQELINLNEQHVCIVLKDGTILDFDMECTECSNTCKYGFISTDVNGSKKPNKWGQDRFIFVVDEKTIEPAKNTSQEIQCQDGNGLWTMNLGCTYSMLYEK